MAGESLVRTLQVIGAALGIPAAAAGTFAAYQSYFSVEVTCQKLRNDIVSIMERNVAPDAKRSLLRKEVGEFDKLCGEQDPDARAIFQAALTSTDRATTAAAGHGREGEGGHPDSMAQPAQPAQMGVFGAPGSRERSGWVALGRRKEDAWVPHFSGYEISDSSLPPAGTVLAAKLMLPVWSEPQMRMNDQSKVQSRLPAGACVRVISTRGGVNRLWAEVAPTSCS